MDRCITITLSAFCRKAGICAKFESCDSRGQVSDIAGRGCLPFGCGCAGMSLRSWLFRLFRADIWHEFRDELA